MPQRVANSAFNIIGQEVLFMEKNQNNAKYGKHKRVLRSGTVIGISKHSANIDVEGSTKNLTVRKKNIRVMKSGLEKQTTLTQVCG